ncbi:MAG: hypothetical protein IPN03_09910 [Holophagales bacterium]|nr:hypothetical protein [Holophagales bacterium]
MPTLPNDSQSPDNVIAFTDGVLVYCPICIQHLHLLEDGVMLPKWLPFISIDNVDDLPQKDCDRCGRYLEDGSGGEPWD